MLPKGFKHSDATKKKMRENSSRYWLGKTRNLPLFKNGRTLHSSGYMMLFVKNHPFGYKTSTRLKGKYIFEHRLTMEKHIGRYLNSNEIVHHRNGKKTDNRIENLEVITRAEHARLHHREKPKRFCSVNDCEKPHEANGFCNMHYLRIRRSIKKL
jgi:hypothetical protein